MLAIAGARGWKGEEGASERPARGVSSDEVPYNECGALMNDGVNRKKTSAMRLHKFASGMAFAAIDRYERYAEHHFHPC